MTQTSFFFSFIFISWRLVQPLWKTMWRFLKKLEIELPYVTQTYLPFSPPVSEIK